MPTEQLIARLEMLIQHYQKDTTLGKKFRAMTHWLQLEIGTNLSPFDTSYDIWSPLATHCWHKMLWRTIQWSGVQLYIDSVEIPLPRENDICLMDYISQQGCTSDELLCLNRCRINLHLLLLSDIITADGLHFESSLVSNTGNTPIESSYVFPPSFPSRIDWNTWETFWTRVSGPSKSTYRSLGKWLYSTHRQWHWFYDEDCDQMYLKGQNSLPSITFARSGYSRTRSQQQYERSTLDQRPPLGKPTSVILVNENVVQRLYTGPPLVSDPSPLPTQTDFWTFLGSWGGTWMWRNVVNSADDPSDLEWLKHAMTMNTAIWCSDGSYDPYVAPDISGAGWIIFDTITRQKLYGDFFERSDQAGSYRGEMIGSLALHILCSALELYYDIPPSSNKILCDNESTLKESRRNRRRVPTKKPCNDVIRHMRGIKENLRMKFLYEHVTAHADDRIPFRRLPTEQKLNCICDVLAKQAVTTAIALGSTVPTRFLFPRETVLVNGWKQTSDMSYLRYYIGKREARKTLTQSYNVGGVWKQAPMTCEQFDEIDWESRDRALSTKGDMYKIWLTKQGSNMNGSGVQTLLKYSVLDFGSYLLGHSLDTRKSSRFGCMQCGAKTMG
jgi:hypothetical protein